MNRNERKQTEKRYKRWCKEELCDLPSKKVVRNWHTQRRRHGQRVLPPARWAWLVNTLPLRAQPKKRSKR